ncbi:class I SAM-dependent methyltransferase [Pectinatus sottacetonis]|uniref:class I SAM-dependent methyltransferase n=1 Tax=Pectinatus sottacetonis TaxID=1002795 RepID=UPI0018C6646E|nr:class I SAM-dependent methyltransferase [Pectinatus sottacetonis]
MKNIFITTGRKTDEVCFKKAKEIAAEKHIDFVSRTGKSLDKLSAEKNCDMVLLVKKDRLTIKTPGGELFFHPSMAQLRLKRLLKHEPDHMVEAMGLRMGMTVLDCTLGFASDAVISAFISGTKVIGLESNLAVSIVVADGLKHYKSDIEDLQNAMHNIEVINTDCKEYLAAMPDKSVDVVYFDPMFRYPLKKSVSLQPLRGLANREAVDIGSIRQACRVARCRVVMKENSKSSEFKRLGFNKTCGGRYSSVRYGIIDLLK